VKSWERNSGTRRSSTEGTLRANTSDRPPSVTAGSVLGNVGPLFPFVEESLELRPFGRVCHWPATNPTRYGLSGMGAGHQHDRIGVPVGAPVHPDLLKLLPGDGGGDQDRRIPGASPVVLHVLTVEVDADSSLAAPHALS
jgi:hypothetical protein